jgi:hypothetical protein
MRTFLLRGFVTCGECEEPMTSCWSKRRNARYPYYFCQHKGCNAYRKSIRKEKIEREFEHLLFCMTPDPKVFVLAQDMPRQAWDEREQNAKTSAQEISREIAKIERKTAQLMDRLVTSENLALIAAYEEQVKKLHEQKLTLSEKQAKLSKPQRDFDEAFRTAPIALPFRVLQGSNVCGQYPGGARRNLIRLNYINLFSC